MFCFNNLSWSKKSKYKIFTSEFDEVAKAENLENINEIKKLRRNLEQQLTNLQNIISKLANKLQRQLLAKQNRSWEFDLEERTLDAGRLTRVITDKIQLAAVLLSDSVWPSVNNLLKIPKIIFEIL